jgi:hypothetical protein
MARPVPDALRALSLVPWRPHLTVDAHELTGARVYGVLSGRRLRELPPGTPELVEAGSGEGRP